MVKKVASFSFALIHRFVKNTELLDLVKNALTNAKLPFKWDVFEAEYRPDCEMADLVSFHKKITDSDAVILLIHVNKNIIDFNIERGQLGMALGAGKRVFVWRHSIDNLNDEPLLKLCHVAKNETELGDNIRAYVPFIDPYEKSPELIVDEKPKLIEDFTKYVYNPDLSSHHVHQQHYQFPDRTNQSEAFLLAEEQKRREMNRAYAAERKIEQKAAPIIRGVTVFNRQREDFMRENAQIAYNNNQIVHNNNQIAQNNIHITQNNIAANLRDNINYQMFMQRRQAEEAAQAAQVLNTNQGQLSATQSQVMNTNQVSNTAQGQVLNTAQGQVLNTAQGQVMNTAQTPENQAQGQRRSGSRFGRYWD